MPNTVVSGPAAIIPITAQGTTEITYHAVDAALNHEVEQHLIVNVDTTKPTITAPKHKFVAVTRLPVDTVPVTVYGWVAEDPGAGASGLDRYWLQSRTDGGPLQNLTLPSLLAPSDRRYLEPGHEYQFQIRAVDVAGYTSSPASFDTAFILELLQDDDPSVVYSAGWELRNHAYASGGTTRATSQENRTATFTFTGTHVAWISTRADDRGQAEVYVDGVLMGTVDLYNAALQGRRIVFAANDLPAGQHTLEVRVLGTHNPASSGTRVDIDAFAVLAEAVVTS
jgi:hypothetical protein